MSDDETSQALPAAESTPEVSAGSQAPESTTAQASSPAVGADWKEQAKGASRDDLIALLEEHPEGATVKERLGQSYADKVLLKGRAQIEADVRRQITDEAWQAKWRAMPREQRIAYRLNEEELESQRAEMVRAWWPKQVESLKNIPELANMDWETFNEQFLAHQDSLGETVAAMAREIATRMTAKEVPVQAKVMAEAMTKDKLAGTLAGGNGPDLKANGPGGSGGSKTFVSAYAKGESNDHKAAGEWYDSLMKG